MKEKNQGSGHPRRVSRQIGSRSGMTVPNLDMLAQNERSCIHEAVYLESLDCQIVLLDVLGTCKYQFRPALKTVTFLTC